MTRILVIEDEENIRANLVEILGYHGFSTLEADNGAVGAQLAQAEMPDLILCDVMIPELDGFGVLLRLHSDAATATIPFIFLTAKTDKLSMRRAMELGADDYLTKPFTPDEVLAAVTARLEKQALLEREHQQKLDQLRDHLIMSLPHEFRTPLNGILGYSDLLMLEHGSLEGKEVLQMATVINQSGQRLRQLIENYLLYARIEMLRSDAARLKELRSRELQHVSAVIEDAVRRKAEHAKREQDLLVRVEDARLWITIESLQKIVSELVDNALKFSKSATAIEVTGVCSDRFYRLSICDQGRGMTAQQLKQVGAYMQFERKLYEQKGQGLGLILAKLLAELHGGQLTIESMPGRGSTVHVELALSA